MAEDDLDPLIGEIYEAALDRELWPRVLEHIDDALGGAGSLLAIQEFSGGISRQTTARIDLDSIADSWEYLHRPENESVMRAFPYLPAGEPFRIEAFFYPTPVDQTEIYELGLRPLNILHSVLVPPVTHREFVAPIAFKADTAAGNLRNQAGATSFGWSNGWEVSQTGGVPTTAVQVIGNSLSVPGAVISFYSALPAGGAAIFDFKLDVPGIYILVDHSLARLHKGAAAFLTVEGPENPEVFESVVNGSLNASGH